MDDYDFDLQSQLDAQEGYSQNDSWGDSSQAGIDYLANQQDWNFGNYQDMNFDYNLSNEPMPNWLQSGTNWGSVDQQLGTNFSNPLIDIQNSLPTMSSVQNTLSSLFNNKGFVTGLGALAEGYQNKKKAAALQQMVSQNRQLLDPFGSQRQFYQQQLQQAVQNPYSAPIVSAQVEQLKRAQDIKNAAAGRRSNSATTDPALLAAMASVAQNYMNSLQTPAGANIGPQGLSNLVSAQQQGINNDVNGYLSPALSALGKSAGTDQNTKTIEALREFLLGGK